MNGILVSGKVSDSDASKLVKVLLPLMNRRGGSRGKFPKVVVDKNGCWVWNSPGNGLGYKQICIKGRSILIHRHFYEVLVGPIKHGLEIDHKCKNRGCCNPRHLETVTRQENMRRGNLPRTSMTHCKRGHEFTPENTFIQKGTRNRTCIACKAEYAKNYKRIKH